MINIIFSEKKFTGNIKINSFFRFTKNYKNTYLYAGKLKIL